MNRVTVIGGSIAGLTLAAMLDPQRCAVTLVEASPDRPPAGTTLAMWPAALEALDAIGAADAVRRDGLILGEMRVVDGRGHTLATMRNDEAVLVNHPALLDALRAVVPASVERVALTVSTLRHGQQVRNSLARLLGKLRPAGTPAA